MRGYLTRKRIPWGLGLMLVGVTVVMCDTGKATETVGEVVHEVAQVLHDVAGEAGLELLDHADGGEVQAEPPITPTYKGLCDKKRIAHMGSIPRTDYFAHVEIPGLDPKTAPDVSVVKCEMQLLGESSPPLIFVCPGESTCEGWEAPQLPCIQGSGHGVGQGEIVVFCGSTAYLGDNETGFYWNEVYVSVD